MLPTFQRDRARSSRLRGSSVSGVLALCLACCGYAASGGTNGFSSDWENLLRSTSPRDHGSAQDNSGRFGTVIGFCWSNRTAEGWSCGIRENRCLLDLVSASLGMDPLPSTWQRLMSSVLVATSVEHCGDTNMLTRVESGRSCTPTNTAMCGIGAGHIQFRTG